MAEKKICVIGGGRWGKNHIKTLYKIGCLSAVVESNESRLAEIKSMYQSIDCYSNVESALSDDYDGYVVATPAETHFQIASAIISDRNISKKNILIEKPMTLNSEDSKRLIADAEMNGAKIMVGHVLMFHPAIKKIKETIENNRIGKLYYLYSTRLNLGTVRTEESVFSSFAPHDISVLNYIIGEKPTNIQAKGVKFLQNKIYDTTMTMLEYPNNIHAHIHVSWLHPFKEQRLVIVGSTGMISFDDSTAEKEIHLYNKRIDFEDGLPIKVEKPDEIIEYERKMPLEEELLYFVDNIEDKICVNTAEDGYQVVKVLEEVEHLLE